MEIFSNNCFFPVLQLLLLALSFFAIWRDWRDRRKAADGSRPGGTSATPSPTFELNGSPAILERERASQSMNVLEKLTGVVIGVVITVINKSVFDDNEAGWKHYSAVINALDLTAIIYVCYGSSWGRTRIFEGIERLRCERR